MKFTDKSVKALKPAEERYELWEGGRTGLGLRVSPKGRKSWLYMYRFDGRARRMTLGCYPKMGVADAKLKYAEAKKVLDMGEDPAIELVHKKQTLRQSPTVEELADEYIEKYAKRHKKRWNEDQRILNHDVLPSWRYRKVKSIKRKDVNIILDAIIARGAEIQANRTFSVIRRMFNFAIERDIIDQNPCHKIKAPTKETTRDRVLTEEEIKIFWHGLDDAKMFESVKCALKLQLITAQRKGEIVKARWFEFDLEKRIWVIPPENVKSNRVQRVPLSELAVTELLKMKALSGGKKYILPSPRGDKPMVETAVGRAVRRNEELFDIAHFTPHDLRRTAATYMAELGVRRYVLEQILNHKDRSVTAIYDRYSYDKEKKEALDLWGEKLNDIIRL